MSASASEPALPILRLHRAIARLAGRIFAATHRRHTILDPQNATGRAIAVGNQGSGLIMDNVIRSAANATAPAIWWNGFTESDVTTVGNTFTVANPISNNGRALSIDNQIVPRGSINPTPPNLPGPLSKLNRQIFEVAAGAGVDAIQQAINSAAAKNGSRPVVHIPYGFYLITKTLQVPASDVLGQDKRENRLLFEVCIGSGN